MLHSYMSDRGGLLLKHNGGAEILLSNGYGDGTFKYYVFHNEKELKEHLVDNFESYNTLTQLSFYITTNGWKVMYYDCEKDYNDLGTELDSNYIIIYQQGTTFYFVADSTNC